MEQGLLINEFIEQYDKLVKVITTKNKVKFNCTGTAIVINEILELLINLVDSDLINDVDKYMIYNVFLISKVYLRTNYKNPVLLNRKIAIMGMYRNLEVLNKMSIKQENFKSRH